MKIAEYVKLQVQEGLSLTAAIEELSTISCAGLRTVWRWHREDKAPAAAERLMQVWAEATPEQRERWFK